MKRSPPKLALPWILEEDWPQWQAVDRGVPSYEKWVELFDKNLKIAEAYGWPYERVSVRPDPFNKWCKANQRAAGKFDRSLYALELLRNGSGTQSTDFSSGKEMEVTPAPDTVVLGSADDFANPAETAAAEIRNQPVAGTQPPEVAVNAPAP